jgi:putative ABC transport system permease protein
MLALVLVVYFQNQEIESSSRIYPKSEIITLERLDVESIRPRLGTLRNELEALPGVEQVAYSSLLPYLFSSSRTLAGRVQGDKDASFAINRVIVDERFLSTYNIPLLAGRDFSVEIANDTLVEDVFAVNVILNELAIRKLGFASPNDALNQVYYDFPDDREPRAYTIVGIMPDQNFQGFHQQVKPTAFYHYPDELRYASIRVRGDTLADTLIEVEAVWDDVIPDYPIQSEFLDDTFNQIFQIFGAMTIFIGGFAFIALALSLIGLFGLSAFMAESRTKEIGIRKVMGANMIQIVQLLIWQFSKPALWALLIAMPLAYLAADTYLNFFANRIGITAGIVAGAGVVAVVFAWVIVAIHAIKIARANPIKALRYE